MVCEMGVATVILRDAVDRIYPKQHSCVVPIWLFLRVFHEGTSGATIQ